MAQGLQAASASTTHLNGTAPRCDHADSPPSIAPQSDDCRACRAQGTRWVGLVRCLTCGWVACSDHSPGRHARAHYEETDHPVTVALPPGPERTWCYVHDRAI
jgi:uncharacterized UBP type Zn finger protein